MDEKELFDCMLRKNAHVNVKEVCGIRYVSDDHAMFW